MKPFNDARMRDYGVKMNTFGKVALIACLLASALLHAVDAKAQNTVDLFPVPPTTGAPLFVNNVPILRWVTVPLANSCVGTGGVAGDGWATPAAGPVMAAQGTRTLPAVKAGVTFTITCTWTVATGNTMTVDWDTPTLTSDGKPLTGLGSFRIMSGYGTALNDARIIDSPTARQSVYTNLAPGNFCITMAAALTNGIEGPMSDLKCKTIGAANATASDQVVVVVPSTVIVTVK